MINFLVVWHVRIMIWFDVFFFLIFGKQKLTGYSFFNNQNKMFENEQQKKMMNVLKNSVVHQGITMKKHAIYRFIQSKIKKMYQNFMNIIRFESP